MAIETTVLAELKEALLAEKEKIEGDLSRFATKDEKGNYTSKFPDDLGTEQSENANEVEEYTDRLGLEKSLETQLLDITDALVRLENGTYGTDEVTGEAIDEARLRAYPAARTTIKK